MSYTAPIIANLDFSLLFCLYTDALNEGLGAILSQKQDSKERILLACASHTLNTLEKYYSTTKIECGASGISGPTCSALPL